jgi:hypothetical protein
MSIISSSKSGQWFSYISEPCIVFQNYFHLIYMQRLVFPSLHLFLLQHIGIATDRRPTLPKRILHYLPCATIFLSAHIDILLCDDCIAITDHSRHSLTLKLYDEIYIENMTTQHDGGKDEMCDHHDQRHASHDERLG